MPKQHPSVLGSLLAIISLVFSFLYLFGISKTIELDHDAFSHSEGFEYTVPLTSNFSRYFPFMFDTNGDASSSPTKVFEDGKFLGQPHIAHISIRRMGAGRFSHWDEELHFSSLDNSDPRTNGRHYTVVVRQGIVGWLFFAVMALWMLVCSKRSWQAGTIKRLWVFPAALLVAVWLCSLSSGALFWIVCGISGVLVVLTLGEMFANSLFWFWYKGSRKLFTNMALALGSAFGTIVIAELALVGAEYSGVPLSSINSKLSELFLAQPDEAKASLRIDQEQPVSPSDIERARNFRSQVEPSAKATKDSRKGLLALPPEWRIKQVDVPGASYAYTWHNALHVYDHDHFRRTTPFPEKDPSRIRIMVLGDSMTYGVGIAEQWSYPAALQRHLDQSYRSEVLNLGVSGLQSADIVIETERLVPQLKPDVVIYGVCLNDFLPPGRSQDEPPPFKVPEFLLERTRLGHLLSKGLESLFIKFNLMKSFHAQILENFEEYSSRFQDDVKRLNDIVQHAGLPAPLGMVLTQNPSTTGIDRQLALVAEESLRKAGFKVVDLGGFNAAFSGESFRVSPWEGHPDEEAQNIFALYLRDALIESGIMNDFRR